MPAPPTNTANHAGQDQETAFTEADERDRLPAIRRWLAGFWRWLSASTFAPAWLPSPLRHPVVGYLVAVALQLLIIVTNLLVSSEYPLLPHYLPFALVVVVVGLYWGVGPSIMATFVGALLLYYGVLLPDFSWTLQNQLSLVGPTLYLLTGLIVSALASQKERARHKAERLMCQAERARQDADDLAASLTQEQAHSDLERSRLHTILNLLPVGVAMADATGQIVEMNPMARTIWGQEVPQLGIEQYGAYKAWWPDTGQRITSDDWAMARALRTGEASFGEELLIEAFDGQQKTIINSAVPIRNEAGAVVGTVAALMDISERKRLEEALRQANRQMDAFLGMASHELKTPLTTIMLGLQVTRRRLEALVRSEADMTETLSKQIASLLDHLANTDRQATRLNRLVNDLLDVSRIQANRLELRLEGADLAAIVREVVQIQRQADPLRTIRLCLPMDQRVAVCIDVDRIGQVVTNYVTNALKSSTEERPVAVGLAVEGDLARIWVRDEGPGIPPEEHAQVWERFHRVPGVEVQSGSGIGLGLGLHISRTIIEQHHGQVGVESVPGQGSTFWFTLPLAPAAAGEAEHVALC